MLDEEIGPQPINRNSCFMFDLNINVLKDGQLLSSYLLFTYLTSLCLTHLNNQPADTELLENVYKLILKDKCSPARRGSAPDRSRCGGGAWPCPRYDLPGQTEASGNCRGEKNNHTQSTFLIC